MLQTLRCWQTAAGHRGLVSAVQSEVFVVASACVVNKGNSVSDDHSTVLPLGLALCLALPKVKIDALGPCHTVREVAFALHHLYMETQLPAQNLLWATQYVVDL